MYKSRERGGLSGSPGPLVSYCKALSFKELGKLTQADSALKALITTGEKEISFNLNAAEDMRSVKKRYDHQKRISNGYVYMALGNLGLNNKEEAINYFTKVVEIDKYNFDSKVFLQKLK